MKTSVTQSNFVDEFNNYGRGDQFTYGALCALYNWFEEMEADTGEEMELDVIALCCEFTEYENLAEFQNDYSAEDYPDMESISDATILIEISGSDAFIIQQF